MTNIIRRHVFVSGRVQMVLFRTTMQQQAKRLRINGFVRNLPDKRVEAVIEGEEDDVYKLIEWCSRGSLLARVDDVEIKKEEYKGEFRKFKIRY